MASLETLGRVRLSRHFFMRDFLYSEIGNMHEVQNIPDHPDLAIARGRAFCEALLDPLQETFGRIAVRSGFRSAELNAFGNAKGLNCARNDNPLECHIWDHPEVEVAGASIVIPWFADHYDQGRDWRDLAWWLYDHLAFDMIWFFPKLCAFNLSWRPNPQRVIGSYISPKGLLLRRGQTPVVTQDQRAERYADFPAFRGIAYPSVTHIDRAWPGVSAPRITQTQSDDV